MGKSEFNHGGGVNYLCLPTDPEFRDDAQDGHQSHSYIYGVEYQSHTSTRFFADVDDRDAPCAVCEVQGRSQVLMIPAKQTCPAGWTLEYEGMLASEHHSSRNAEFVCVSSGMEVRAGGSASYNEGLLYVVEARCGALPCPPYSDGYELSCVVCTK